MNIFDEGGGLILDEGGTAILDEALIVAGQNATSRPAVTALVTSSPAVTDG